MSEGTREQIASRLRTAREAAGLSQGQTAKLLDMHRPTISEIEAGRRKVSSEELVRFAELFGVSVEWIMTPSEGTDPSEDRIVLAARELGKMKDQDLDRLLSLLRMIRKRGGSDRR
jgi:transcriptional regulator with XRE-family HTH domain